MPALKNIFQSVNHLFFPSICAGCATDIINDEQLLCLQCMDRLPVTNFHLHANNPVEKIFWGRLPLSAACSYLYFTKDSLLQHLLHQFKYKGDKEIGLFFGRRMGESFLQSHRFKDIDALVPLPLFPSKERKRGFNQATILCEGIAETMHIPILKNYIVRTAATQTQTHKTRVQRWKNMEGKFVLKKNDLLKNKHVLLVDDVVTTGATLEACSRELLKADGIKLSIATLAYTST